MIAHISIKRVIIVSTEEELEKFKGEIASLPEDFRESVGYLKTGDLSKAVEHMESLKEFLKSIGLLKLAK